MTSILKAIAIGTVIGLAYSAWTDQPLRALDGDTLAQGAERIRLRDFDAPELFSPKCEAERALALRAKAALQSWIDQHPALERSGTDKFGRTLASSPGLAAHMIGLGLAVPFPLGRRPDWCGSR